MEKNEYTSPQMELIFFDDCDVVRTSAVVDSDPWASSPDTTEGTDPWG